jgi:hypothetical protein
MSHDDDSDDCFLPVDDVELFYEMHGRRFNVLNTVYLLPSDADEIKVRNAMPADTTNI